LPGRFSRPRVALICPSNWDRLQLSRARERLAARFVLIPYGPDAEANPSTFDADSFVARAVADLARWHVDAVVSSSDYPGCILAAVIAEQLGVIGADPEAVLRASHKFYARQSMARSVPEANPRFALLRPDDQEGLRNFPLRFPFFVKPVKSWFSQYARIVDSADDLTAFLATPGLRGHLTEFVRPFNQLMGHYRSFDHDASFLIGEELLVGRQVTLEGFVLDGSVEVIGIVDSIMYSGTSSFERFVYPSTVQRGTAKAMTSIAERAIRGLGLNWSMFNIEFIDNPDAGSIHVVEINPRMCGQFADLMEAVNGINTYEILCDLALGRTPSISRFPTHFATAASFPRRRFSDGMVVSTPGRRQIAQVKKETAASLVAVYYQAGQKLSAMQKHFDGTSYRYLTINVAAAGPGDLGPLADDVERRLGIEIIDCP
jgi:biotin carboxylase